MKNFALMIIVIFISIGFLYISKKRSDKNFDLNGLNEICGRYIERSEVKTSRGHLFNFIVLENNDLKYKFALSEKTILKTNKMEFGNNICVSYGEISILDSKVAIVIN